MVIVRTLLWLLLVVVSCLVGGVAGVVLLVFANPGVKGPNVTDDQLAAALVIGSVVGALIPLAVWRWRARFAARRAAEGRARLT